MTARRATAKQLRAKAAVELFEHAPLCVAIIDRDHRVVAANRGFVAAFGEAGDRRCHELCRRRAAPCTPCPLEELFAGATQVPYAAEATSAAEQSLALVGVARALRGADRRVEAALVMVADQTRQTALESSLGQVEHLAQAGLSAAGLAHTIKNILLGLDGALYMVDSALAKNDADRLSHGWEMVKGYIGQVATLVRNLLEFAKPGERPREAVAPAALVDEVVALHRAKAASSGVTLQVTHAAELPPVWLDRLAIHSALANLVHNALDACHWDPDTDKEHRITVTTAPADGGGVVFVVADNGMGISLENQRRLLHTHFTTKGMRGTGLGLLLTQKAVAAHGGSLSFTSTPGQGSEFRLALPAGEPIE